MTRRRKSPILHTVKTHSRDGSDVDSYKRGIGTKQRIGSGDYQALKYEGTSRETPETFTVTFNYSEGRKDVVIVGAIDSDDALNRAMPLRKRKSLKVQKVLVEDGIGDVVKKVAKGLGRVAKGTILIAARAAGEAKGLGITAQREYRTGVLNDTVKDAYSDNPTKRMLARNTLREKYPDIWRHFSFQRV